MGDDVDPYLPCVYELEVGAFMAELGGLIEPGASPAAVAAQAKGDRGEVCPKDPKFFDVEGTIF